MPFDLSGVHAALITPRTRAGDVDAAGLCDLVDFVVARGVDGICIGGGTSEYAHLDVAERERLITAAARHLDGRAVFIAAIGAGTTEKVLALGRHALDAGAHALLLPMPHFFRYEAADLEAFTRHVARALAAPLLLYNLPSFTNGLDASTARRLMLEEADVVGMKDSSGDRAALEALARGREDGPYTLLCGADGVFLPALDAGWDGGISGLASFCPELLVSLYRHARAGDRRRAARDQALLDELVAAVGRLPFPWVIRLGAELRGLPSGPLPLPLSQARRGDVAEVRAWLQGWLGRVEGRTEAGKKAT